MKTYVGQQNEKKSHFVLDKMGRTVYLSREVMLVNFAFSNFYSFRDKTEFSMIASKIQADKESLIPVPSNKHMKLLPISAVYGGNASGKTNFVRALFAVKQTVLEGKFPSLPFLLDAKCHETPTSFTLTILVDNEMWEYHISLLHEKVQRETLTQLRMHGEPRTIFDRKPEEGFFVMDETLYKKDEARAYSFAQQFGKSLTASTPLLTACETLDVPGLKPYTTRIIHWLKHTLKIAPAEAERKFIGFDLLNNQGAYSRALSAADTGIRELVRTPVPLEQTGLSREEIEKFRLSKLDALIPSSGVNCYLIKEAGVVKAYKWGAQHADTEGENTVPSFPLELESDGTMRLMNLLPILLEKQDAGSVYVMDELDRSTHPNLTRFLIEQYLREARRGRLCQLIFTTHDAMLLDQNLLRRDEFWVAERTLQNVSQLIPFSDYSEVRKDKDLRKSYLQGRLGGVPDLQDFID